MSDSPFTVHGDEALEARIVSWVLGEASAFEEAELERLCGERPELLVFRRRMRALHGLLTEAEKQQPDEGWKLPPEKRRALDEIFGDEKPRSSDPVIEKRVRFSARRALLAIAACLVLTLVVAGLFASGSANIQKARKLSHVREPEMKVDFQSSGSREVFAAGGVAASDEQANRQLAQHPSARPADVVSRSRAGSSRVMAESAGEDRSDLGVLAKDDSLKNIDGLSTFESKPDSGLQASRASAPAAPAAAVAANTPAQPDMDLAKLSPSGGTGGSSGGGAFKANQPMEYALRFDGGTVVPSDSGELSKQLEAPAESVSSELQSKSEIALTGQLAAGEKKMKAVEKMPVLGERMTAEGIKGNGTIPETEAHGWFGRAEEGAVVSGGRLQTGKSKESNADTENAAKSDSFFDTSKVTESNKPGGVEYEIQTGYSSEYLFKGKTLADAKGAKEEMTEGEKIAEPQRRLTAATKPDLTKLMEEISAAEDPYSTFSLNISDASFKIAQAALAKGGRPDPAGIKVEQFYNAVDYGDPAPAANEPVAVNIEQSSHPVIPGRNLVRVALKTAAAGRSAAQPLRLTLLVDQSGSMSREDRRAAMNKALAGLSGLVTANDAVSIVGFSRTPRLLADGLTGENAGKLADFVNLEASEGGTNLEEAIKLAGEIAERHKLGGAQNRIVLFTDGAANLGNADPVRLAEKVKGLRQKGIAFDIAGIAAEDLNDDLLGELARNGNGRYYIVGKGGDDNFAKQLAGAFRPAAENVKVQVRFNPERVGRYKLIGFEKDRLKTEDFRNDAVDAAELAAEEAGTAIYQVEPLPDGKGEIGEVSVRFRDTAADQMVERTWTIRHDSAAPAFDRATPSMQLATLAMLAAEKLKGGPLAEAIDFKELAAPAANVKRFYGTNGRPGEVLQMLDALK